MTAELPPAIQRARIHLMLEQPYLAAALARLPVINAAEYDWCATMATDGYYIYINPAWTDQLPEAEISFILAHEVLHCVLGHIDRRGNRRPRLWNVAIDYATNVLLVEFGMTMPTMGLFDRSYTGMTADGIYARIAPLDHGVADGGEVLHEPTTSGSDGGFDLHLDPADERGSTLRAREFPTQAERKRMRIGLTKSLMNALPGRHAGFASSEVNAATAAHVPWQSLLARFVQGLRRSDYRLFPPNRRYIWRGLYLPSVGVPGPDHLIVVVDTSGSMTDAILSRILAEIDQLRAVSECKLTVVQCDADIQGIRDYDAFEAIVSPGTSGGHAAYRFVGRGGTNFVPAFAWVEERIAKGLMRPDCMIMLTDGFGTMPAKAPAYPVLWIITEHGARDIPFGTVIRMMDGTE